MNQQKSTGKDVLFRYVARTFLPTVDKNVLRQFASGFAGVEDVCEKYVGLMCNSLTDYRNRAAHANPDATITILGDEVVDVANELIDYLCERSRGMLSNEKLYDAMHYWNTRPEEDVGHAGNFSIEVNGNDFNVKKS